MFGGLGPLEIIVLLVIFFVLFGAERLPKMANALGRSKGPVWPQQNNFLYTVGGQKVLFEP